MFLLQIIALHVCFGPIDLLLLLRKLYANKFISFRSTTNFILFRFFYVLTAIFSSPKSVLLQPPMNLPIQNLEVR